jgi:metallopeptidase MepB
MLKDAAIQKIIKTSKLAVKGCSDHHARDDQVMFPHPFQMPPQPPPNFNATPESLVTETRSIINSTRNLQDNIITSIQTPTATVTNVLLPLALDENESLRKRKIVKFYSSTSSSTELREASNVSEALFVEFDSQTLLREDLFLLIDAVFKRNEDLDEESKFYLQNKHREFERNGMGIKDIEKRNKFIEVRRELYEKTVAARKSLNASAGIWFTQSELDGLHEHTLNGLKGGDGENAGKLWLPLKKPHLETALKYARNATTRRRVYVGNDNRCMDNVPRYREIVLLRDEAARLLGYANHAEFQLEVKMAGSVDFVNDFIDDLRERLTPVAKLQLQALRKLKMNDDSANVEDEKDDSFYLWDYSFYANLSNVQTNSFDEKKFSEYFTLERSLAGMMDTFSRLFGVRFHQILPEEYSKFGADHTMTWHESVSVYSVWASDNVRDANDFVGYLYLDLFPRENKYNHAGHYLLQPASAFARHSCYV